MSPSSNLETKKAAPLLERIRYPIGAVLLVGYFLGVFYNRFFPAQETWFANYGEMMKRGKLPYRDFYCFIQPIPLLISRFLVGCSEKLIYFRYYACAERLLLTCALYWMLRQQFSRFSSFVATVTSVIVMTSCLDDALFSYYATCLLFSLVAMGAFARALASDRERGRFLLLSGIFLGLAFYSKQSLGGLMGISFFLVLMIIARSVREWFGSLIKIGAGFSLVGLPFLLGMLELGISSDYLRDVFFNAVSQKGGASVILTGFFSRLNQPEFLIALGLAVVLLVLLFATGMLRLQRTGRRREESPTGQFYSVLFLFFIVLAAPISFNATIIPLFIDSGVYFSFLFVIPLVFYAATALLVYILTHRRRMFERELSCHPGLLVLVAGSMAGLYAVGMSYQISASAMVPSLGVCLAFFLDFLQPSRRSVMTYIALALSVFLVSVGATKKYLSTYWWYGWEDTSLHPSGFSRIPQLAGFNLNPAEIEIYERITDLVEQNTGPGDHVFSFPNCPMFNYLTGHLQPTFSPIHYLDVCPDSVAHADAASIRANPPRIIIWLRATGEEVARQESLFRGGRLGGFSDMENTLCDLTASGKYERVFRHQYNDQSFPIEVWKLVSAK
jgi:hypothetical protein